MTRPRRWCDRILAHEADRPRELRGGLDGDRVVAAREREVQRVLGIRDTAVEIGASTPDRRAREQGFSARPPIAELLGVGDRGVGFDQRFGFAARGGTSRQSRDSAPNRARGQARLRIRRLPKIGYQCRIDALIGRRDALDRTDRAAHDIGIRLGKHTDNLVDLATDPREALVGRIGFARLGPVAARSRELVQARGHAVESRRDTGRSVGRNARARRHE